VVKSSLPSAAARVFLRESQRRAARATPAPETDKVLALALARTREEENGMVLDGEWLRQGVFKYPVESERRRWARTREILERISPGPHEDPTYVAMLAHQAAAIELVLGDWAGSNGPASELARRIIIGTTALPRSEGSSALVDGTAVIEMSAGMIEVLYQSSKAIVLSWKPVESDEGPIRFDTAPEKIAEVLDHDPEPTDLLFDTLVAWLYDGRHRVRSPKMPPPRYHPPLKLLINGAERFVLAHEYGHALMDQLASDGKPLSSWDRELRADAFATLAVARSSAELDRLPPAVALQGAVVAMRAHDVLDGAVQIALHGQELGSVSSKTHPSFVDRLAVLEQLFLEWADDEQAAREQLPGLQVPARTLAELWRRVTPGLRAQYRAGRRLHEIWSRG
jgi:hypothetical protein